MAGPKLVKKSGERITSRIADPTPVKLAEMPELRQFASRRGEADVWWAANGGRDSVFNVGTLGLELLEATLRQAPRAAQMAAGFKMADWAHDVMALSRAEYVPKDTFALHDSGMADEYDPSTDAGITQIAMWYAAPGYVGGADQGFVTATDIHGQVIGTYRQSTARSGGMVLKQPERYALEEHENMELQHPPGSGQRGGVPGPKYLERPFLLKQHELMPAIAQAITEAWGGSGLSGVLGTDAEVYSGTFGPEFGVK